MKKITLITICLLLSVANLLAQTYNGSKPPTQKEIDDAAKAMQQISNGMSPEQKKMMEQMGIKLPTMEDMTKVSAQQMQQTMEIANRVVPPRDDARIAAIPKTPLTNAALPAYLSTTHQQVLTQLPPAVKAKAEEVYQSVKSKYKSARGTGNFAAGLWMNGKTDLALYLAGKACIDDPSNTDNLNNYASMLSMCGAEQLSIPVLNKLNKQFPKNSTILNNIGQAWFGLGDIALADAYLDSTIRLFPKHSQANATKSSIEESKGNSTAAIAAMKTSIHEAYSIDKQDQLSKLGYEFSENDIKLPFNPVPDPMGLEKFIAPRIPKSVEESILLKKEWSEFKDACDARITQLSALRGKAEQVAAAARKKREEEIMTAGKTGNKVQIVPVFSQRVTLKLKALSTDADGYYTRRIKNASEKLTGYGAGKATLTKNFNDAIKKLNKEEAKQDGEGKANADFCPRFVSLKNDYIQAYNTELEQIQNEFLDATRQKFNQETYYKQYILWPEDFEVEKLNTQISWISIISSNFSIFVDGPVCGPEKPIKKVNGGPLPDFDDIHCEYHSELSTPVGKISMDCSRLTAELDLDVIKLGIKQNMNKEGFSDQFMGCSVEVGVSKTIGTGDLGPLKAEASVSGGVKAEFDRNGLKDITAKAGIEAKTGADVVKNTDAGDINISAKVGLDVQVSLISGHGSIEGAGTLSGMSKTSF